MKILNILATAKTGGIEVLCKNIVIGSKEDNRICCLFEKGEIYDELKSKGIKVFSTVECNKNIFEIVKKLESYCKKEKIDILIMHHGGMTCNVIYLLLKRKLKNVKFVRYLHGCFDNYSFGNDGNFVKRALVKFFMQKALDISDLIIYISKAARKSFEDVFKIENNKSIIIYNGIPNKFFENCINKRNVTNITYIGRLSKLKGINLLIEAIGKIYKHNENIKLIVTGDGEEKSNLEKTVKKLYINKAVDFTGRKTNVIPILDSADIFVYPSICEEGFGISVVEAMARGCIPITFNKGGLPEIITNGINGVIVKETSSDALAQAIEYVLNMDDEEKNKMRLEARKKAENFTIDNTIQQIEKALKSL